MSSFVAAGYLTNAARTEAEVKTGLDDWLAATKQIPGAGIAETTLTLALDAVTPPSGSGGIFSIDTEAAAATDNLANIVQTNIPDGSLLIVRCVSAARVVVVKHSAGGAGQISLVTAGDFTLGDPSHWLLLKRTGALWEEVARFPQPMRAVVTRTSNIILKAADIGKLIDVTSGTFTQTFEACATLGKGWWVAVKNSGTGIVTLDPNAAETIDAAPTLIQNPGDELLIVCDGSNLKTFARYHANDTKTTVASATTPDIWTGTGNIIDYTGTTTATGFAAAPCAGARRTLICAGAAPFTHGANFLLPGSANYTAAAGDRIEVVAITTTQFRLSIFKADGTAVVVSSVLLYRTESTVGNDANTSLKVLQSYTVLAGRLAAPGDRIRVRAWGRFLGTTGTRQIQTKFGATIILDTDLSVSAAGDWMTEFEVIRTSATSQVTWERRLHDSAITSNQHVNGSGGAGETLANAIVVEIKGKASTAVANDTVCNGMTVEFLAGV